MTLEAMQATETLLNKALHSFGHALTMIQEHGDDYADDAHITAWNGIKNLLELMVTLGQPIPLTIRCHVQTVIATRIANNEPVDAVECMAYVYGDKPVPSLIERPLSPPMRLNLEWTRDMFGDAMVTHTIFVLDATLSIRDLLRALNALYPDRRKIVTSNKVKRWLTDCGYKHSDHLIARCKLYRVD